jgi:acetyltransferase-like isoleucine patch superfamily enzyme
MMILKLYLKRTIRKARKAIFYVFYKFNFQSLGWNSVMFYPYRIDGIENICIEKNVEFQSGLWIYCKKHGLINPEIIIQTGCTFGYNNHIVAIGKMCIGENVLTSNNVYISDNIHDYQDIDTPIKKQAIKFSGIVNIGSGTWIGENVSIIGATIGKNCVIGSNSVVTKNIPDYSVAVGVPARVIKQYNINSKKWELK